MAKFKRILITAGPTREMFDPVRYVSNLSTGEMGYAIARAAKKRGYHVTLISGPTGLKPPQGISFIAIVSAKDLQKACQKWFPKNDVLIMSAAVCDYTAKRVARRKIRRSQIREFALKPTPDIVAGLAQKKGKRLIIGFCLETQNWLANARAKLQKKKLDGIVANFLSKSHVPFGPRSIQTAFLDKQGVNKILTKQSKSKIADKLMTWLERGFKNAI